MSVNRYNSATGELEKIAGGTLYADAPIGTISPFGGSAIPSGYLLCDGTEVLKTAYAELYAVIGDAFGTASDNTKFVLPDLREATTKGVGLSGKSENHYSETGVVLGEFIEDRLQSHTHGIRNGFDGADPDSAERGDGRHGYSAKSNDASGRTGNTTEVKAVGVNYIIKAKQIAIPADIQSAIEEQNSYSTEETYTGKRWIDGKPIYRKVLVRTGSASGTGELTIGTIDNFAQLVNITTITNSNAGSNQEVEFYRYRDSRLLISNGTAAVKMDRVSNYNIDKVTMIVEYTKTTD